MHLFLRFVSLTRLQPLRCGLLLGWLAALAVPAVAASTASDAVDTVAEAANGCGLLWRVQVQLDTQPRQWRLELVFDAGNRQRSTLRLPGGWAGFTEVPDAADTAAGAPIPSTRLQDVPGSPQLRSLTHAPGERVRLQWRLRPTLDGGAGGGIQWAARWFAFSGQGVLPWPEELDDRVAPVACIAVSGLPAGSRWVGSHGVAEGASMVWRVPPGPAPLAMRVQQALYAGGALQVLTSGAPDARLTVAMPQDAPWRFGIDALAQAGAKAVAAQRRYWGDTAPGLPGLLLLMPDASAAEGAGGTAWHQALALQAPTDLAVPGAGFDDLMAQALARAWLADRFGPLAHAGRGDEDLRAWFSEGWAEFLAHRSLLREGQWTAEDYAMALNRKIDRYLAATAPRAAGTALASGDARSMAAARGEWLALRWHAALRANGRPGLEALMQRQLVPAAQARREGPISAPLATHRLLAAARPVLGDNALGDLKRYIDQGEAFTFGPAALGPCFVGQQQTVGRWQLGFDAASLGKGVVMGVEPGGPAEAVGLRDGMVLRGHALAPGDATQTVRLQVQGADGAIVDISYLPAGAPLRDLPRYRPVPQALQQSACQGWLGLGPEAALAAGAATGRGGAAAPPSTTGTKAGKAGAKSGGKSGSKSGARTGTKTGAKTGVKGGSKPKSRSGTQTASRR